MKNGHQNHRLHLRRLGIDTYQEPVIYMRADCPVCRSEGFEARSRVLVKNGASSIIATLNVVHDHLLSPQEAGLSEVAWRLLGAKEGDVVHISHPPPVESLSHVRAKVYGKRLGDEALCAIIQDVVAGRYSDVELASFITACAASRLDHQEVVALTRAMVDTGERLDWGRTPVMDKHCVGGLPGNRTTLLVVPIVASFGLLIPKTSSRAITSPAGTADTMATIAPVELPLSKIRKVVEQEGGCIAWGGTARLSPADDVLIRVEKPLDLDSEGQLVASVLSKKIAAGSTHVVLDIPAGPTAKVRSPEAAQSLSSSLQATAKSMGIEIRTIITDGSAPVGRGIGPALEARDALAVLRRIPGAPEDLRSRSLLLAGAVLELSGRVEPGQGERTAEEILASGKALSKFEAICTAQGGMHEPPQARHTHPVTAERPGKVRAIDNRLLARVAKLAGAPQDSAAGVELHTRLGKTVSAGEPLFTIHAETPGELAYALEYVERHPAGIVEVGEP